MDAPGPILSGLPRSTSRGGPAGISLLLLLVRLYERPNWTGKYEELGHGSSSQVEVTPLFFSASPVTVVVVKMIHRGGSFIPFCSLNIQNIVPER